MTATPANWRPHINAGDVMRVSTTYETRRASWYESMGIMVVWEAWDDQTGLDPFTGARDARAHVTSIDPFAHAINENGNVTHGHLTENNHHGGTQWLTVNPNTLRSCKRNTVQIAGFVYTPGDSRDAGQPAALRADRRRRPVDHVPQLRREPAESRACPASPQPRPTSIDLAHGHGLPGPVRAGHRHLVSAGQRRRGL